MKASEMRQIAKDAKEKNTESNYHDVKEEVLRAARQGDCYLKIYRFRVFQETIDKLRDDGFQVFESQDGIEIYW